MIVPELIYIINCEFHRTNSSHLKLEGIVITVVTTHHSVAVGGKDMQQLLL